MNLLSIKSHSVLVFLFCFFFIFCMKDAHASLSEQDKSYINLAISANTNNMPALKQDIEIALKKGISINEINEVFIQLYAYAGFPKALNAINCFMGLIQERKNMGIEDLKGKEASHINFNNRNDYGAKVRAQLSGQKEIPPKSGYQVFCPVIDDFLKEHLFADIFARDVLDHRIREIITISILGSEIGLESQLKFHLKAAKTQGLTNEDFQEYISIIENKLDKKIGMNSKSVLDSIN